MRAHFEKVTSGADSLRAFERIDLEFPFFWHYHPEFELTLIVESSGQRLVGDGVSDYGPGDLVLLGPNLPHSWRSTSSEFSSKAACHRAIVIQFREDFLGESFFKLEEMESVVRLLKRSASGLAFGHSSNSRSIAQRLPDFPSLPPSRRIVRLLDVLLDLAEEKDVKVLSTDRVRPMCRVEDQRRIERICKFLNDKFDQELDYRAVARNVHMDQASLCRFFKRATGRTMTTYVNELRVGAAAQLLTETDLSILEIAFKVGFGNYSNFNRQFKRIKGYGPRTLRQQFLADGTSTAVDSRPLRRATRYTSASM
jgi:AraC-like DNA-binding protein